jgi:hypothetical protein
MGNLNEILAFNHMACLARLTSKTDQDIGGYIRVFGKSGESSIQLFVVGSAVLHSAAALMRDRKNAIDVREFAQTLGPKAFGNRTARSCRTVDSADQADVIARSDAAVGSLISHERAAFAGYGIGWAF